MEYLKTHAPLKEQQTKFWPRATSALVFTKHYFPHPYKQDLPLKKSRIALYAQGTDYHLSFKKELLQIAEKLKTKFPNHEFLPLTDSSPVLERDLAATASLGWFGKNTCLIHPKKGSLFFLGEIYSDLSCDWQNKPLPDFCGTCNRCIEICPTQALESPRLLNSNKCISFLTIESKTIPPLEMREKIGDWFFGCDLCQTVCPWNQKIFKDQLFTQSKLSLSATDRKELIQDLQFVLNASGKTLQKSFYGLALARAGSFGLKRNAIIVAANQNLFELKEDILKLKNNEKLAELVNWALEKLD